MRGKLDPAAEAATANAADQEAETRNDAPPVPGSTVRLAEPAPSWSQTPKPIRELVAT